MYTLPRSDQELLGSLGYKEKLAEVDSAIQINAEFLHEIAKDPGLFDEKSEQDDAANDHRLNDDESHALSTDHSRNMPRRSGLTMLLSYRCTKLRYLLTFACRGRPYA